VLIVFSLHRESLKLILTTNSSPRWFYHSVLAGVCHLANQELSERCVGLGMKAFVRQGVCRLHETVCRLALWWRDAPLLADGGAYAGAMCGLTACMEKMVVVAAVSAVTTAKRRMIATALVSHPGARALP
jgi:hypothetical protein